jgi:hypothetical protein
MTRGPANAPIKQFGEQTKPGGSTPVANILLPHFAEALPIRLMNGNRGARRIAESRRRPI